MALSLKRTIPRRDTVERSRPDTWYGTRITVALLLFSRPEPRPILKRPTLAHWSHSPIAFPTLLSHELLPSAREESKYFTEIVTVFGRRTVSLASQSVGEIPFQTARARVCSSVNPFPVSSGGQSPRTPRGVQNTTSESQRNATLLDSAMISACSAGSTEPPMKMELILEHHQSTRSAVSYRCCIAPVTPNVAIWPLRRFYRSPNLWGVELRFDALRNLENGLS